ncbi:MAG: hypothetical protein GY839_11560 [candidate division Zixibacteria bacterium]|nr:hypothetical protein [candidate division Zixibacteria bacterium]
MTTGAIALALAIVILPMTVFIYAQNPDSDIQEDEPVDLEVELCIDSIPQNAIYYTADSSVIVRLYKGTEQNPDVMVKQESFKYSASMPSRKFLFPDIAPGTYAIRYSFKAIGLRHEFKIIDISTDTTISLLIKPSAVYAVKLSANPEEFYLRFKYLSSGNTIYFIRQSDEMTGELWFCVLGDSRWKFDLCSTEEFDKHRTKIKKKFGKLTFSGERNPFLIRYESAKPFETIELTLMKD